MKTKFVILMNDDVKAKCMSVEITQDRLAPALEH